MTPQPGDFGLTRINGLGGRLIRAGQYLNGDGYADYEHAFIVGPGGQVIEADPSGARAAADTYPDSETVYSSWPLTDRQRLDIVAAAYNFVGTPYSWLDYVSIALRRLGFRPQWLRDYVASSKHLICSQLVDAAYTAAGVPLFTDGRWAGDVTPACLLHVLEGPE